MKMPMKRQPQIISAVIASGLGYGSEREFSACMPMNASAGRRLAGIISPSRIECDPLVRCSAHCCCASGASGIYGLGLRQFNELIAASLSNHQSLAACSTTLRSTTLRIEGLAEGRANGNFLGEPHQDLRRTT